LTSSQKLVRKHTDVPSFNAFLKNTGRIESGPRNNVIEKRAPASIAGQLRDHTATEITTIKKMGTKRRVGLNGRLSLYTGCPAPG
jgi:hypothetical protein